MMMMAKHSTSSGTLAFLLLLLVSLSGTRAFQRLDGIRLAPRFPTASAKKPFSSDIVASPTRLLQRFNKDDDDDEKEKEPPFQSTTDSLMKETSRILRRVSWLSWWSQVILTTISSVILLFARNVAGRQQGLGPAPNVILSGAGVLISAASIVWTWGNGARLSRRLTRRPATRIQAAQMLRRAVRVGASLNLVGLFVTLLAAEEIVGALAIKVLTNRSFGPQSAVLATIDGLQPLDILIVQANTNTLLSHFCSLVSFLYLTGQILKLDPPSTEGKERNVRV